MEGTKVWLGKARLDLRAAEHDLLASPPLVEDTVFHCQQAIEKALKGFLVWHDNPFRKTHDIDETGEACIKIDPTLTP
ncbi:MAG: HEPN domain-containing protein [Deltaproteobacteria bacterium]|nr:HEPN domain-containing protein [Deltaproteobacteria bacterium]